VRSLIVASLLVAFAGFSGGCNRDAANDPAQDKAFQDQLKQAAAGNAIRNKPPKGHMPDMGAAADKPAPGAKPDAAKKPDAADKKVGDSGN